MPRFVELVKEKAEVFRAMKEAGMLSDREEELLELAGLEVDEKKGNLKSHETLKPRKSVNEPRKARKPQRPVKLSGETQKTLGSVILLSKPVKTVQDRLRL